MADEGVPEQVRRFLASCIDSVAEIEALLYLSARPGAAVTIEQMAGYLYAGRRDTELALAALCERGFLRRSTAAGREPTFAYSPLSAELARAVDLVAATYPKHLVEVTRLIHAKRPSVAQGFADAFRVK